MDKKAKFFRRVVANIVIVLVLSGTAAYVAFGKAAPASSDIQPVYNGFSDNHVSLMVNVHQNTPYVDDILHIFSENGVQTTFFTAGIWVSENSPTLKKMFSLGHEIANHGYFQKDHKRLSAARTREEITLTHEIVKKTIGIEMNLFAPPLGSYSSQTVSAAKSLGYTTILWSKELTPSFNSDTVRGGDLILVQPNRSTVDMLDRTIKIIKARGLSITPVSAVL
ncbi:MAG: polysaccharide deacetylase family protein [Firmicutes bacterium]|nr:polysaccharide deacetylase family protein [Bacillota bacterium]